VNSHSLNVAPPGQCVAFAPLTGFQSILLTVCKPATARMGLKVQLKARRKATGTRRKACDEAPVTGQAACGKLSHTELAGNAEKGKSKEISHAKPRRPQRGEGLTQRGEVNKGQKHDLTQRRRDAEKGKEQQRLS
jgi:hypothetical protein